MFGQLCFLTEKLMQFYSVKFSDFRFGIILSDFYLSKICKSRNQFFHQKRIFRILKNLILITESIPTMRNPPITQIVKKYQNY